MPLPFRRPWDSSICLRARNPVTIAPMPSTNNVQHGTPTMPRTSETIASGEVFWGAAVATGSAGAAAGTRAAGRRAAGRTAAGRTRAARSRLASPSLRRGSRGLRVPLRLQRAVGRRAAGRLSVGVLLRVGRRRVLVAHGLPFSRFHAGTFAFVGPNLPNYSRVRALGHRTSARVESHESSARRVPACPCSTTSSPVCARTSRSAGRPLARPT